mgnify:CR=1 FL=1
MRAKDGELARLAPVLSRAAAEAVVVDAKDAELKRAGVALADARRDADKAAEELAEARSDAEQAAAELGKARASAAAQTEDATEPEAAAPDARDEELARLRAELAEARVQIEAFKKSVPGVETWRRRLIETAARASPPPTPSRMPSREPRCLKPRG